MSTQTHDEDQPTIWSPLYRSELETLLAEHKYTRLHLYLLYWLIWLPLLSTEELVRLFSIEERTRLLVATKKDLSEQVSQMTRLKLIDSVTLREPHIGRHQRYYVTDLGLYLYLSVVRSTPPLTVAQLAKAYPVERDDLAARLARPPIHLALTSLATRLIAEGGPLGYHLGSYQQPWQHTYMVLGRKQLLRLDAALLIEQLTGTKHAFFVRVDPDPRYRSERNEEKFLLQLLDLRQKSLLSRQSWPGLLIITVPELLVRWSELLFKSYKKRLTKPLAGGITTIGDLRSGIYTPIWWDLAALPYLDETMQSPRLPLHQLFGGPASAELAEQFSQQVRFYQLLIQEAAVPPKKTRQRLTRYVGDSLQYEAATLSAESVEEFFARARKDHRSFTGTGLLSLALTPQQKEMVSWMARHPLLDLPTLQILVRPGVEKADIRLMQRQITQLFKLRLVETKLWPEGKTALEQQRYLLTTAALRFVATRNGDPFSAYIVPPKYRKNEESIWRQWSAKGLFAQMYHTNGLYLCMRNLLSMAHTRAEVITDWRSAHEAARPYRDPFTQKNESVRPDAELTFSSSPDEEGRILLEYERGTTDTDHYYRKFKTYLDYRAITQAPLPLILVVVRYQKTAWLIRQVLADLEEPLPVVIVLERDLFAQGLAVIPHRLL